MRLLEAREVLKGARILGPDDIELSNIVYDSRAVTPGASGIIFAAIPGSVVDGHSFIKDAVDRGACAVLAERPPGVDFKDRAVTEIIVPDVREAMAALSARLYGNPSDSMTLVGVTGTNGKTTTTYLLESIFKEAGFKVGVIGTVNYRYGGKVFPASRTTPEAPELQRMLREMKDAGVTHCAMEVSSHALKQKRVNGCAFDAAIFTNLSHEHLDYHNTIEEYFEAKALLFGILKEGVGRAVINADDAWSAKLPAGDNISYGLSPGADVRPLGYKLTGDGIEALALTPRGTVAVSSRLVGEYNLRNILGAVAVGCAIRVDPRSMEKGVSVLERVPGRLEKLNFTGVNQKLLFNAYVDYAHTPDALERTLLTLREISEGRVITVFGCGGNRDREKRPIMGALATALSSVAIITSDNPRDEDPLEIIRDIESGIEGVKRLEPVDMSMEKLSGSDRGYIVMPDRSAAIRKAVTIARPGDTLLVAGKGHEDYQIVAGKTLHFEDSEELKKAVASMSGY